MPQIHINLGTVPNDGTGMALRVGGQAIEDNFTELYGRVPQSLAMDATPILAGLTLTQLANAGILAGGAGGLLRAATIADIAFAGQANGLATLDAGGKLPAGQLPPLSITDTYSVASQAAMLALVAQRGDVTVRTDVSKTFILAGDDPAVLGNWIETTFAAPVSSVAGRTGAVTLAQMDVSGLTTASSPTFAGLTLTGPLLDGANGAASVSAGLFSGTWFTGGTATTTKPQVLIEPAGTMSNNWSTLGTGLGLNAAAAFAGKLIDLQVSAKSVFSITKDTVQFGNATLGTTLKFYFGNIETCSISTGLNNTWQLITPVNSQNGAFRANASGQISWGSDANHANVGIDTTISRNAAGVMQIGSGATNNAGGSLALSGLTASGIVKMTGLPTVNPNVAGQLWNNGGVLTVSAG